MKMLEEARQGWRDSNIAALKITRPDGPSIPALEGLRSVAWKECLLFDSNDRSAWPSRLSESRSAYNALRTHFLRAIEHPDELESAVDPLADTAESPWEALRRDEALRAEIFQDVERCMPENVYFRQPTTQTMLLDVLFIFCKLNPDVGYRQGMHELLAPIVWVIERDALDSKRWERTDMGGFNDDKLLFEMLDQRYIEHDAFTLFGLVMQNAKSFYEPGSAPSERDSAQSLQENEAPILIRIKRIDSRYLPNLDPELSDHLTKLDVVPQVFLMRWIRLLFGREFPFDDTLGMWDALFAIDPSLELVDFICIAMLLRIRWQLVQADANTALTLLLRYPPLAEETPPRTLVQDAMYLKLKPNPAGGAHIVEKYSHRRPAMPSHLPPRPRTPSHASTTASGNIAAPSSPRRSRSPFGSPTRFPSSSGLEGLLGDAARAAYNRGERWGLNRAVRDAVGEVKKNVQAIQVSPRNSMHQRASSTDLFRKVQRLEKRNQALAAMLEEALGELWECQRRLAESLNKSSSTEPNEDHEEQQADAKDIDKKGLDRSTEKQAGDDLGIAIAKVQFIQVYLTDTTMPLPQEENPGRIEDVHEKQPPSKRTMNFDTSDSVEDALAEATANPHTSEKLSTASKKQAPSLPPPEILFDASAPSSSPEPSEAPSTAAQPIAIPSSSSSAIPSTKSSSPPPRPILTKSPPTVTTTAPTDVAFAPASRPSLEQSAFSYILGHDAADRQHAFAAAAPFSDEATRRSRVADRMGKGFLFGEDDEGKGKAEESPDRKSGAKGKPRNTLRKKPPASAASGDNSAAGRKGSVDAQGKGKGKTGDGGDEEIDLEAFSHHSSRS